MRIVSLEDPRLQILACGFGHIDSNKWNYSEVSLPCWRLYWNASPGARIWTKTFATEMKPSTMILLAPNTVFSTRNTSCIQHLFVHFQMPEFFIEAGPSIISLAMRAPLLVLTRELASMISTEDGSKWKLSLTARSLVSLALARIELKMTAPLCRDARILNLVSYLNDHLHAGSSNAILARQAGMSVAALGRLFKEYVGYSLQEYARRKRIEKACLMLQFSNKSIEQIVEETGFCDRYHFSRIFKSIQGISPAAFRRLHAMPASR